MKIKKTMMNKSILLILLFGHQFASGQQTYVFTKGLFVNGVHHYGREALYIDTVAWQLYNQVLQKPEAGKTAKQDSITNRIRWTSVTADSAGVFKSRRFGAGGYLYLTYTATRQQNVLLNIKGNSAVYFNGVLHAGDPYGAGWLYIPVTLKKGLNELYVRTYFQTSAAIIFPEKPVMISTTDSTMPHVVLKKQNGVLQGAVVIINSGLQDLKNYQLKSIVSGKTLLTNIPVIPAMSSRKVIFNFDAGGISSTGKYDCGITLQNKNKSVDEKQFILEAVDSSAKYSTTFISQVDGSLQYYSVTPQLNGTKDNAALFLSVHGAGVEAIGQAKAYQSKDWGTLVAATNRRPRGFNWEDWGRLDALEVLNLAKEKFKPDPQRIYLTGHSMGGHGTWFLGAAYPGNWAAIAPCSGYPTLKDYGSADGKIPDSSKDVFEQMLLRAGNQSDVISLANNYKPFGVYVLHGDSDKVVSVNYARQMKKLLAAFHPDFNYYEYPDGEHWFGDQSVDWKPLFDFFKWHTRLADTAVNQIDFTTSSPGISSTYRWASILQQQHPLQYSNLKLVRDRNQHRITGTTKNIHMLQFRLKDFGANTTVTISLDNSDTISYSTVSANDSIILQLKQNKWVAGAAPSLNEKGPQRYGTFKEAFNHHMVFVYGTAGDNKENEWSLNKARYDAETWYYRGNGAVDVIADKEYSLTKYKDRGIVLYGNSNTNSAWKGLLNDCPIQVERNKITAGDKVWSGGDLGAYFVWPVKSSFITSVAVISGTGLKGMQAASANQYFAGASGFPDFMIYDIDMLQSGAHGVKMAGFFNNEWKLDSEEFKLQQ
ncbi:MAG: alpha/beta hydrolase [Ferruginibacter sp.]|uniref:carboxylesterase family protein n=1 Tax=Ferruginibacter sp. TaxID=1940288 RepID=UPI00265912BC|nr:alpha/beta hydrolase-fold protein [Ferruginibacter sp.]MDB5276220.1 alpha/beta hydrolase [Ferruginibacter sp.]